jgi:ribosome-binding protein aMBF1 (putative translation factor)
MVPRKHHLPQAVNRRADPERAAIIDRAHEEACQAYELGVLVRDARVAADLSQSKLAKRVGTSQSAIARLESGGAQPTIATLRRIATAIGVDLVIEFRSPAGAA